MDVSTAAATTIRAPHPRPAMFTLRSAKTASRCAAALGVEAERPRRSIPRAEIGTAAFIGIFFIVLSYVQLAGFDKAHKDIATSAAPLDDLAHYVGVPALGTIVSLGIVCSAFGIALACLNAASRIVLKMSEDRLLPEPFSRPHPVHRTPFIGVLIGGLLVALVPSVLVLAGDNPISLLTDIGERTAIGLLIGLLIRRGVPAIAAGEAEAGVEPTPS